MTNIVTAATVRDYFRADAKRMGALSEAAQKTVTPGARGLLHPEAIKAFNGKRAKNRRYAVGNTKVKAGVTAEQRASLAEAGIPVGKRGPLSKAAKAHLRQNKG